MPEVDDLGLDNKEHAQTLNTCSSLEKLIPYPKNCRVLQFLPLIRECFLMV